MMLQKRLAGQILKCSPKRVKLDESRMDSIREAITKVDIRGLIREGAVVKVPARGVSRARARHVAEQLRKGRRKGQGNRRGKATARLRPKKAWMARIRLQRSFLRELKERKLISHATFNMLYRKAKGGFFRNKRHLKLYLNEQKLIASKG
ncbi:50S ribosomal protein L19e [Candidatus Woesearchaeota archaeon]|nr:50S ribosomal protein L19e [Candidatus Woesearchaeota archaeon]